MLAAAQKVIDELRDYLPISERKIHYELLNDPPLRHAGKPGSRYANDRSSSQNLSDLLTRARLAGEISFESIADPTRPTCVWQSYRSVGEFARDQLDRFLQGYARDLMQSQPNWIEIVGEKNTIEGSIRGVAATYCIPYTLGRGYCSLDPRYKIWKRFKASGKSKLILLLLSDFDPDGEEIVHSFAQSMRDDFGIPADQLVPIKVCLTHEQVLERDLPVTFDIKKSSTRYKKFARKYGDRAHELEALHPAEIAELLEEAIKGVLVPAAFNHEVEREQEDAASLEALRKATVSTMKGAVDKLERNGRRGRGADGEGGAE